MSKRKVWEKFVKLKKDKSFSDNDGNYGYKEKDGSGALLSDDGSYGYMDKDGSGAFSSNDGGYGYIDENGENQYFGNDDDYDYDYDYDDDDYDDDDDDDDSSIISEVGETIVELGDIVIDLMKRFRK